MRRLSRLKKQEKPATLGCHGVTAEMPPGGGEKGCRAARPSRRLTAPYASYGLPYGFRVQNPQCLCGSLRVYGLRGMYARLAFGSAGAWRRELTPAGTAAHPR